MRNTVWVLLGLTLAGCGREPVVELSSPTYLYLDEGIFQSRVISDPDHRSTAGEDPSRGQADMLGWRSRVQVLERVPGGAKVLVVTGYDGYQVEPRLDGRIGWIRDDDLR